MTPGAQKLYDLLRYETPHREVYGACDGGWYVTYGGGEQKAECVHELVRLGLIQSVYSTCPQDAYHVGKTLDIKATTTEREKHANRKNSPLIYTDGSREFRK